MYPSLGEIEDETAYERNLSLLKEQVSKAKVNSDTVRALMKRTFNRRRKDIIEGHKSVQELVEEFPMLRKAVFVCWLHLYITTFILPPFFIRLLLKWN